MEDIKVHGTYINDRKGAKRLREVSEEQALKFITQHTGIDTSDFNKNDTNFLNKGWLCLFFDVTRQAVVVLYRHDYTWALYAMDLAELKEYAEDRGDRYKRQDVLDWIEKNCQNAT